MRQVYYEATYNEVNWWTSNLGFGIIGWPNTKRAADMHVIPKLCFVSQCKNFYIVILPKNLRKINIQISNYKILKKNLIFKGFLLGKNK